MKNTKVGIQDLIQEAKLRTVWWMLCIFAVTYILTRKLVIFLYLGFLQKRNDKLQNLFSVVYTLGVRWRFIDSFVTTSSLFYNLDLRKFMDVVVF